MASQAEVDALKARCEVFAGFFTETDRVLKKIENDQVVAKKETEEIKGLTETMANTMVSENMKLTQNLKQGVDEMRKDIKDFVDAFAPRLVKHELLIEQKMADADKTFTATYEDLYHKCDVKLKEHSEALVELSKDAELKFQDQKFQHEEMLRRVELTFQDYQTKLSAIEGIKSLDKY